MSNIDLAAFNDYESEFRQLTSELPTRINTLIQYESNQDKAMGEIRRITSDLSVAKQRVADMEMANRGIAEPTRRELANKIRTYKDSLATLQKDLKTAETKFSRDSLMSGARSDRPLDFDKSTAARDRMQANTDKLRGGTDVLNDANRRIEETLDVGIGIMGELDRNRETLHRIRGNASEAGGQLDVARRILRGMSKREVRNKIIIGVFAVIMLAVISIIIYVAVKRKS